MFGRLSFLPLFVVLAFFSGQPRGAAHEACLGTPTDALSLSPPVKPAAKKKSSTSKEHLILGTKIDKGNSIRNAGIFSLVLGGYCIFFAVWGLVILLTAPLPLAFLPFLVFAAFLGIYLTIRGVSWIDQSYIMYSEHLEFKKSRVRRAMILDFVFAGLLFLSVLLFFSISYFTIATIALACCLFLLFMAFLKLGQLRQGKKENRD